MTVIDVDALLAPISEAAPSGPDLGYDAAFHTLEEASRGKAEQQYGDTLIAATGPDWRTMKEQALALLQRTRDLRVAIALMRAAARLDGFAGFATGLALLHGLLERQWDTVHPQLDASDHDDPTMRLNALDPLADAETLIADLRAAPLSSARGSITVRQVELAFGKVDPIAGETAVSEAGALQGIADAVPHTAGLLDAMRTAHDQVRGIDLLIAEKIGAARGPDLKLLRRVTEALADAARAARGDAVGSEGDSASADAAAASPALRGNGGVPSAIANRDDALKALDQVCEWIERHEPTNPAPLLIRRAKRLMTKSFMDIVRDLAPDGLSQVERIAGVENE